MTIHLLRHRLSSITAEGRTGKTSLFIEILGQELPRSKLTSGNSKTKCYTSVHVMPRCSEKQQMPTKVKKYFKRHFKPHTEAFFTICSLNIFPRWSTSVFSPRPFPITWDFVHHMASVSSCACAQIHSCFSMSQQTVVFVIIGTHPRSALVPKEAFHHHSHIEKSVPSKRQYTMESQGNMRFQRTLKHK